METLQPTIEYQNRQQMIQHVLDIGDSLDPEPPTYELSASVQPQNTRYDAAVCS